jgi:chromosomal replication initiator protein
MKNQMTRIMNIEEIEKENRELRERLKRNKAERERQRAIVLEFATNHAAEQFETYPEAILGRSRISHVADARQVAMATMRKLAKLTLQEIGDLFKRDHGTVIHACNAVQSKRSVDASFRAKVERVESILATRFGATTQEAA